MMKTTSYGSPYTTITMGSFGMGRLIQAFGDNTPLQSKIFIGIEGSYFICSPTQGTMIKNHIFNPSASNSISFKLMHITKSKPYIPDNNIISIYLNRVIPNSNSVTWSRLSGQGQ